MAWFAWPVFCSSRRSVIRRTSSSRSAAGALLNVAFGLVLGLLIIVLELRLKTHSVTHLIGALLGGAIGLVAAKTIGAALYWANLGNERVVFLHSFILLALPYLGLVLGGRDAANGSNRRTSCRCSARRPAQTLQDTRHERHHRRPHRRHL